ncbi:MAG: hypothetical protein IPN89_16080 [Saprospiraceae bacterium]|nr:hypothetical protein [Saprospiraceae bacterium]
MLILQISVLSAQWTKIDDQSLDLRTILSNNFDTGIIIGWSSKLGNVISRDEGVSFQKFKSSISPYSYYIDKDTIYVGGYYNKVEYTTDYGLTFKDITTSEIKDKGVKCFAKYDNNTLLVGTIRNGIYAYNKSTGTWLNIGHKGQEISSILVKDNFIFAAVEYQDVSKSNDFGKTWTNVIYTNNNPATNLINYKGNIIMSTIGTGINIF